MTELFSRFARRVSVLTGSPAAFLLAVLVILVWVITGPLAGFSNTWQLIINTGTTIVTFLMVFLIQNSQNRESQATQLKLDELIRALTQANNGVIDIENASEEELARLHDRFQRLHERMGTVMDPNAGAAADAALVEEPFAVDSARVERARRNHHGTE
jgi:low affinity Fe/Cu permease